MDYCTVLRRGRLPAVVACGLLVCSAVVWGQVAAGPAAQGQAQSPADPQAGDAMPYRVTERPERAPDLVPRSVVAGSPVEHPLMPALRWAYDGLKNAEKIHDYSATMVKRERIDGKLGGYEYIYVKIRHRPFSAYLYFLDPPKLKGREVLFIEGRNDGKLWAHGTGLEAVFGTVSLKPNSHLAMRGQLYPLTDIGILNLVRRLVEIGENDSKYEECEVKFYKGAKVKDRVCTCIEVIHPKPRRNFLFHIARIFVDDELNLVIRYASYDWPKRPGQPPPLLEEYNYLDLKLNNGFADADFDIRNPNYGFK